MEDIISKVEQLNKKATEINQRRERLLGQLQNIDSQIETKLADYNKKHNTKLSVNDIPAEYKRVEAETTKKAEETAELIQKIESGDFVEKKITADVVEEEPVFKVDTETKPEPVQQVVTETVVETVTETAEETVVVEDAPVKPIKPVQTMDEDIIDDIVDDDFVEKSSTPSVNSLMEVDDDDDDDGFIDVQEESVSKNTFVDDDDIIDDDDALFSDIKNVVKRR